MFGGLNKLDRQVIRALDWLVARGRRTKFALLLATDAVLCVISVWIAFSLRLGEWYLWNNAVGIVIMVTLLLWAPIFISRGIYRSIVRFIGSRTWCASRHRAC